MQIKITKFGHSCVLVETPDRVALFDPGDRNELPLDRIDHIDRLIMTHEHDDHSEADKVARILKKFPDIIVVCNNSVKDKLEQAGVKANIKQETNCTKPFKSEHALKPSFMGSEYVECTGYNFKNIFSHPGDNIEIEASKDILAMPISGGWLKSFDAISEILRLKPQYVLLIHDWHLTREAFDYYQDITEKVCKENNINFIRIANGEPVTLSL